jgi:nucleoside-diphosphate-sugar epimerase
MATLVTGAAGFIGSHAIGELLRRGQGVRGLVRKESQAAELRARGSEAVVGDVRDPAVVRRAVEGVQAVVHCAAAVGHHYSEAEIYAINLDGVRNVLESLRQAGRGRLVLVSSINVLGSRDLENADEDVGYRCAKDPHADVKIEAERAALDFHRRHGVEVTILRPGLIYGVGEKNIPRLLDAIRCGKFRYLGSRNNMVPMVHIDDVVQALLLAAEKPEANGRVYHIADGSRTTIGELVDYLSELSGAAPPQKTLPLIVPKAACVVFETLQRLKLRSKPGPINRVGLRFLGTSRSIDISRARRELGYEPRISFREGMAANVRAILETEHDTTNVASSAGR